MTYIVDFNVETLYSVAVEADSKDNAQILAYELFDQGECEITDENISVYVHETNL